MTKKVEIDSEELAALRLASWRYEQVRNAICADDTVFIETMESYFVEGVGFVTHDEFDRAVDDGAKASSSAKQVVI